jgi:hypothetical protein
VQRHLRSEANGVPSSTGRKLVDKIARNGLSNVLESESGSRRKAAADEATPRCVRGRIGLEQGDRTRPAMLTLTAGDGEVRRRKALPIPVQLTNKTVARYDVATSTRTLSVPVNGGLLPKLGQQSPRDSFDEDVRVIERAGAERHGGSL